MKKLFALILVGLFSAPALAESVDKTIDAAADGHVDVSNIAGSVTVNGWSRDSVRVTGTLGKNVEELIFERDGDKILIKVKVPKRSNHSIRTNLNIDVPRGSSIDVGTVSANIEVSDVHGEQSLHSVSGDVDTSINGADVKAETVSGDVDIEGRNSDGEVSGSSVSGDVTIARASGEVTAEAVSGNVIIDEGSYRRAVLSAVSGNVVFQGELQKGGKLKAETVSGNLDIDFMGEVSAKFDVNTLNGRIKNCFGPKAQRTSKYGPGLELEFIEGDGDGYVGISAINGTVNICKK